MVFSDMILCIFTSKANFLEVILSHHATLNAHLLASIPPPPNSPNYHIFKILFNMFERFEKILHISAFDYLTLPPPIMFVQYSVIISMFSNQLMTVFIGMA